MSKILSSDIQCGNLLFNITLGTSCVYPGKRYIKDWAYFHLTSLLWIRNVRMDISVK